MVLSLKKLSGYLESLCAFPLDGRSEGQHVTHHCIYDAGFTRDVHYASDEVVVEAVDVASNFMAKERFRGFDQAEVVRPLMGLSQDILAVAHDLADIEARWTSRSWHELATASLPKASETIQWYCAVAPHALGRFEGLPVNPNFEYREDPLGVVAAITPWNDPLVAFSWKVVPALLAGNCVVWKPSEHCPETAHWVVGRLHALGLPKERLQLLLGGREVGEALVRAPIQAVSFTGSSRTARRIASLANETKLVKMHIEAGGKGCAVIGVNEPDAALKQYAEILCDAAFSNQGQICSAPTLVFSPGGQMDRLIEFIQAAAIGYAPGDPTNRSSRIGGLISREKRQSLQSMLESAAVHSIALTHSADEHHGFDPTLVIAPPQEDRLVKEELFGPIIGLLNYRELDEAISFINRQEYGLANGLFSSDHAIQRRFSRAAMGGILHINSWGTDPVGVPFGGTRNSGFGKEKSLESIGFFTTLKPVCRMS